MEKLKRFLSTKFAQQSLTILAVIVTYTVFILLFTPAFAEWVNCVTDVFIGAVLVQIFITLYEHIKADKRYRTWQYYVSFVVSLTSVGLFFFASRANTMASMLSGLIGSATTFILCFVIKKFMYTPSTMTMEELIDANWDKMKAKAKKLGYEKFLAWEKGFRCYPTDNGTIEGDLLFDRPYYVVEKDGKTIPLTYNGAMDRGLTDVAEIILDDLVKELKASNV